MKIMRPHPLITGIASTATAALACALVLLWGTAPPNPLPAHGAGAQHTTTVSEAAHHDPAASTVTTQRFRYATSNADPRQNYADLFLPADYRARTRMPIAVLIHGGSWARGVSASTFNHLARDLTARGVAVYNVEYRRVGSGGGWPTTFTDVAAALDALPGVFAEYPEIDPNRSVLVGHSAGAQLAAWAGLRTAATSAPGTSGPRWVPRRIISVSGPLDLIYAATHGDTRVERVLGGSPSQEPGRYRAVDPIELIAHRDNAAGPEFIAVHGTADRLVPDAGSERFVAAYLGRGGRGQLRLLPGQTHSSMLRTSTAAYRSLLELIADTANR